VVRRESERAAIAALIEFLRDRQDIRAQYRQSFGLCLSHFEAFLEGAAAADDVLAFVIGVQIDRLTALSSELGEYLRKHDYRFSHEAYGEERDAFIRATEMLAGAKPGAALLSQTPPLPSVPSPQATEDAHGVGRSGPGEPPQSDP
jgi:hypothetical protein